MSEPSAGRRAGAGEAEPGEAEAAGPGAIGLTVLGWSGCPTTGSVDEWVQRVCGDAGIPAPSLRIEYVETDEDAAARRFVGSPTFLRDGVDLFPEPDAPSALTCRVYRRRDGRFSPLPDPADFVAALGPDR